MTERYRRSSGTGFTYVNPAKMENEFTPKKTMIIMVIVVACFAVLWPRIFYPMLYGSVNQQLKPSAIDKTTGCCYVLSETDVDTIKIMSELCGKIIKEQMGDIPLTGRQIINVCQDEVYRTCGLDITVVLQEQVRLGHTTKHILDEIRSLNGSLCLKYNFGVQPWSLGVPHMITLKNVSDSVRQERSPLVRSEMVHPAFRERGRAIPQPKPTRPHRVIEGKPGPIPGMRPTLGGPGHVVPPSKQGSGSMGIIMPIYTIGIVIFFTYTLMKIICKKHPETDTIYSKMDLDGRFTKESLTENGSRGSRDTGSCKLVVNAMSALLDEVDQEIEARRKSSEVAQDECASLSNGSVKKDEKPSVKIMAMETTESCEGGKKWQSANSAVIPSAPTPVNEHVNPPQEIYLDRTLPAQSQILVSESATETEKIAPDDDSPVVLAGKMTLSVISLENEELEIDEILKGERNNTDKAIVENKPIIKEEINHIIEEAIESINQSENNGITIEGVTETDIGYTPSEVIDNSLLKEELLAKSALLDMNIIQNNEQIGDHLIDVIEQKIIPNEEVKQKAQHRSEFVEETDVQKEIGKEDSIDEEKNGKIEEDEQKEQDHILAVEKVVQKNGSDREDEETLHDIVKIEEQNILLGEDMEINSFGVQTVKNEIGTEEGRRKSLHEMGGMEQKLVPNEEVNSSSPIIDSAEEEIEHSKEDIVEEDNEGIPLKDEEIASSSLLEINENSNPIIVPTISSTNNSDSNIESHSSKEITEVGKASSSPKLNLNTKSSSEDSGSTVLSDSNQGSVINVNTRHVEEQDKEEKEEEEEVSEEESEVEYEEEEIEISEEEEVEDDEEELVTPRVELAEIQNQNLEARLVNGSAPHNGVPEDEESEEEIEEEIIEEYSDDDEGNWVVNSD